MLYERLIKEIKHKRDRILSGKPNCIPSCFKTMRRAFPGTEKGKYYLITGAQKSAKTQIASYMFIYSNLLYAYDNRNVHLKIFYFNLEEDKETILLRFMSHLISTGRIGGKRTRVSSMQLQSVDKNMMIDEHILEVVEDPEMKSYIDFFEEHVIFFDSSTVTGILNDIESYAENNGTILYKEVELKNEETGDITKKKVFDRYEPNDKEEYVIPFIDHISLVTPDSGKTLRESILRLSNNLKTIRNKYKYTPVVIQQQSQESQNLEAFKANKIRPTTATLSDCKDTAKDVNVMFGITNPSAFDIDRYLGYDIKTFRGNFRVFECVVNRNGNSNDIIALFFDGATCEFKELPKPNDTDLLEKVYKVLDEIRNETQHVFLAISNYLSFNKKEKILNFFKENKQ